MNTRKTLGLAITIISTILLAVSSIDAFFETSGFMQSSGTVRTIGVNVWWNQNKTLACTSIDWGVIEPGSVLNTTVYVENPSNTPIQVSMTTSNWTPANMTSYSSFTWNREGVTIEERLTLEATFTLTIFQNITETMIEEFSFDITITGTST